MQCISKQMKSDSLLKRYHNQNISSSHLKHIFSYQKKFKYLAGTYNPRATHHKAHHARASADGDCRCSREDKTATEVRVRISYASTNQIWPEAGIRQSHIISNLFRKYK